MIRRWFKIAYITNVVHWVISSCDLADLNLPWLFVLVSALIAYYQRIVVVLWNRSWVSLVSKAFILITLLLQVDQTGHLLRQSNVIVTLTENFLYKVLLVEFVAFSLQESFEVRRRYVIELSKNGWSPVYVFKSLLVQSLIGGYGFSRGRFWELSWWRVFSKAGVFLLLLCLVTHLRVKLIDLLNPLVIVLSKFIYVTILRWEVFWRTLVHAKTLLVPIAH